MRFATNYKFVIYDKQDLLKIYKILQRVKEKIFRSKLSLKLQTCNIQLNRLIFSFTCISGIAGWCESFSSIYDCICFIDTVGAK